MTTSPTRESAKIYQFPVGGRRGLGTRAAEAKSTPSPQPVIVSGGCWYHEEAVQQAERGRTNQSA